MRDNRPKPDDRSDNREKIEDMIQDTLQNMEKANETMELSSDEEKKNIADKNERREQAVRGMRQEIKDEAPYEK